MANYTIVPVDSDAIKEKYGDIIFSGLVPNQPHLFDNVTWANDKDGNPTVPLGGNVHLADGKFAYVLYPTEHGFVVKKQYCEDPDEKDPVLRAWGDYVSLDMSHAADVELQDWLNRRVVCLGAPCSVSFTSTEHSMKISNSTQNARFKTIARLRAFNTRRSERYRGKVTVYKSQKDRDNDREVAMKPGRAFRLMFPELPQKSVDRLTDEFLQVFALRKFTIHTASDAESFQLAYAGIQSEAENIRTTCWRKHLSSSCMRYDFNDLPMHPAEAYASGDFDIVYVTDEEGLIGGRCVVYKKHNSGFPQPGPVYGVSEQAIDMISDHLVTIGAVKFELSSWVGARLVRRDYKDGYIAPYLDLSPQALDLEDSGKYLVVTRFGEIDASNYNGVLGSSNIHCYECSCGVSQDDHYYSSYNQQHYCHDCYHEEHIYCDWSGDSVHLDETSIAHFWRNDSLCEVPVATWVLESEDMFVLCSDNEYWHRDHAYYCEFEDKHIPVPDLENYFWSEWDGKMYPNDEFADVVDENGDTESVSKNEAKEAGCVLDNDSGLWIKGESKDA